MSLYSSDVYIQPSQTSIHILLPTTFAIASFAQRGTQDVHEINSVCLERFPGEERMYRAADTVDLESGEDDSRIYPIEFLNSCNPVDLSPSELKLKKGVPLIFLPN